MERWWPSPDVGRLGQNKSLNTRYPNQVLVQKLVDWVTRRPTVARSLLAAGVVLLTAGGSPALLAVVLGGPWPMSIDAFSIALQQSPVSVVAHWAMLIFGCVFLGGGGYFFLQDRRVDVRQLVLVVEMIGLRDITASPLLEAVPKSLRGMRVPIVVDLRQNIVDGELTDPKRALAELSMLPAQVRERCVGRDRRDIQIVIGGLAPVPLLFFAGLLLDDESEVSLLDWDRHRDRWRRLDGEASSEPFQTVNAMTGAQIGEVALCISASYRINLESVSTLGLPVVHSFLPTNGTAHHWSESDQETWGQQFLDAVMALEANRVERIHLFVAAPSSLVLRLGRLYDKRNLPALRVYQYQRSTDAAMLYPWAIEMPVAGRRAPEVVATSQPVTGQFALPDRVWVPGPGPEGLNDDTGPIGMNMSLKPGKGSHTYKEWSDGTRRKADAEKTRYCDLRPKKGSTGGIPRNNK